MPVVAGAHAVRAKAAKNAKIKNRQTMMELNENKWELSHTVSHDSNSSSLSTSGELLPSYSKVTPNDMLTRAIVKIFKYQDEVYDVYTAPKVQVFVAILIMLNFLANIIGCQIDPFSQLYATEFLIMEDIFNILFLIELLVNIYGSWFWKFWQSSWNVFDFVVVVVGMMSVMRISLPGPLGLLRMLRAFRVFRLFKRIKSLNRIIVALTNAVPGVLNAFVVLSLVMCIYAILAVDFFGKYGQQCGEMEVGSCTPRIFWDNANDTTSYYETHAGRISSETPRRYLYGEEYWGNFGRSIYTLFQVLTGESWSEVVARPLLFGKETNNLGVALYFVSFVFLCAVVLINIVVAVLLEHMVTDNDNDFEDHSEEQKKLIDRAKEEYVHEHERIRSNLPSISQLGHLKAKEINSDEEASEELTQDIREPPNASRTLHGQCSISSPAKISQFSDSLIRPSPSCVMTTPSKEDNILPNKNDHGMLATADIREGLSHILPMICEISDILADVADMKRDLSETRSGIAEMRIELEAVNDAVIKNAVVVTALDTDFR